MYFSEDPLNQPKNERLLYQVVESIYNMVQNATGFYKMSLISLPLNSVGSWVHEFTYRITPNCSPVLWSPQYPHCTHTDSLTRWVEETVHSSCAQWGLMRPCEGQLPGSPESISHSIPAVLTPSPFIIHYSNAYRPPHPVLKTRQDLRTTLSSVGWLFLLHTWPVIILF